MENFIYTYQIDAELCDNLIKYYTDNIEYKNVGTTGGSVMKDVKDSIDVTFFNCSTNPVIVQYFKELQRGYNEYSNKFRLQSLKLQTEPGTNIQYYPPGGGYKPWHWERHNTCYNRQLVYMTYLNTVDNGGTEWFYQELKLDAVKGLTVIWPADFSFAHKGIISTTQEKWIATGWFSYFNS
jgi:hypothetical protein